MLVVMLAAYSAQAVVAEPIGKLSIKPLSQVGADSASLWDGCGAAFWPLGKSAESAANYIFWHKAGDRVAVMNLDGGLIKLSVTSAKPSVGKRYIEHYFAGDVKVTVDYIIDKRCPRGALCEGAKLTGHLSVRQGNRRQTLKVAGYSGC